MDSSGQQWRETNPTIGDVEDTPDSGSSGGAVVIDLRRARTATGRTTTTAVPDEAADDADAGGSGDGVVLEGVVLDGEAVGDDVDGLVRASRERSTRTRREILPSWARSRAAFEGWAAELVDRAWRTTAFHAVRVPLYWLRASARSPRTLGRVIAWTWRVVTDSKGRAVRSHLTMGQSFTGVEGTAFLRVTDQHAQTVKARLIAFGIVLAILGGLGAWAWMVLPGWVWWATAAVVLPLLGLARRDPDARPVVARSVSQTSVPRFTSELVLSALGALGIGELNKNLRTSGADAVRFVAPIHRDGPGWRADVDLPVGVTAGDVIERRDRLASGLRRPVGCVWPEPVGDAHPGRLLLWVGDRSLAGGKVETWSLAKAGKVDLFRPFPIGVDQRGRQTTLTLMFASMIIGAVPRMGKTFFLRLLALGAALDVTAQLHVYDLKGSGDLAPLEAVAHRYRAGDQPEDLAYVMADLRALQAEMSRRYVTLRSLPRGECPENKVHPGLSARRDLGLHPVFIPIDECQYLFEHPDHGAEAEAICTDLVKRGPAVGIMLALATQRVDAKSIPTGISSNAQLRFCLRVMGQTENDMVLGTSMYKAGVRATTFTRYDLGVGYLVGEGAEPVIVRGAYVDAPGAEAIVARARAARIAADRLTGHAAGIEPDPDELDAAPTLLDDLAEVMKAGQDREWSETLLKRLAELRPATYATWTPADLGNAANAYGITTVQIGRTVDGVYKNKRGLDRATITAALTQRDEQGA